MKMHGSKKKAKGRRALPLALAASVLVITAPSAGLAVVSFSDNSSETSLRALDFFTPASVDPELASRATEAARKSGLTFTPAGTAAAQGERTVTIAVRVDNETAEAISVRGAINAAPGRSSPLDQLQPTRYNLGAAVGYESFAKPAKLPQTVRNISMPDLSAFEPSQGVASEEPSRLQPRIALEGEQIAGRSRNTLDSLSAQTVDLGGSYSLTNNLDVTAGVRISQERDRLAPLTDAAQDSQAVYIGTQFRF